MMNSRSASVLGVGWASISRKPVRPLLLQRLSTHLGFWSPGFCASPAVGPGAPLQGIVMAESSLQSKNAQAFAGLLDTNNSMALAVPHVLKGHGLNFSVRMIVWGFLGQRRHQRKGWELLTMATKLKRRESSRKKRGQEHSRK